MKFSTEIGIKITDDVKQLLMEAVSIAGNKRQFSILIHTNEASIGNWLGDSKRGASYITWDKWRPVRDFLAAHNLIDKTSARWMLPSELRLEVNKLRGNSATACNISSPNSVVTGGNATFNNYGNADALRTAIISAILDSSIHPECIVKVCKIIRDTTA